jgi:hypothetical protein
MLSSVMMGQEVECFQQAVEPILYEYGVNLVLTGERYNLPVPPLFSGSHTQSFGV